MKEVVIPDKLYEYLENLGVIKRLTPSDIVVELILNSIDIKDRPKYLADISDEYLKLGDELKNRGDIVVAGEMYWRGLSYLMKAVALRLGFEIQTYQDYFSLVDYLAFKYNDGELVVMFTNSERLHGEYHPRPQGEKEFEYREEQLKKLVKKLREILQ
ncbi:PaREP1 family protein [Sulfurisphaera javensis]|uniref:PaREP1 family protein n=1 Tax=Sulfurisphaera javensis TaxID=2049879 RepID=A0AAT9GSJ5_9CREN